MLRLAIVSCAITLAAGTAHADDAAAIAAAKAWYAAATASDAAVTASKEKPVHYLTSIGTESCAKLKAGKATSAAQIKKLGRCLADTQKEYADDAPPHMWEVTSLAIMGTSFPRKHRKDMAAVAKGATIIDAVLEGNAADIYIVVAPDGTVRAVWLSQNAPG